MEHLKCKVCYTNPHTTSIETHLHFPRRAENESFQNLRASRFFLYVSLVSHTVSRCGALQKGHDFHQRLSACESSRGESLLVRKALKVESESSKSNKDSDVLHFESHSRHLNVHEGRQCRLLAWANGVATLCVFAQVLMIVSETERKKKKKKRAKKCHQCHMWECIYYQSPWDRRRLEEMTDTALID